MKISSSKEDVQFIKDNYLDKSAKDIGLILNRSTSSIENKKHQLGLKSGKRRSYSLNEAYFSQPNLENSYWAGFLAADGYLRSKIFQIGINLCSKDKNHLVSFKECINFSGSIKDSIVTKKGKSFKNKFYFRSSLIICSKHMFSDLLKWNLTPKKSLTLKPPKLNEENSLAFIKGLIDGDGSILKTKNGRIQLSIDGSKDIIYWIASIFDTLVPPKYIKLHAKPRKRKKHFVYKVTGYRAMEILQKLETIKTPFLIRKWQVLKEVRL